MYTYLTSYSQNQTIRPMFSRQMCSNQEDKSNYPSNVLKTNVLHSCSYRVLIFVENDQLGELNKVNNLVKLWDPGWGILTHRLTAHLGTTATKNFYSLGSTLKPAGHKQINYFYSLNWIVFGSSIPFMVVLSGAKFDPIHSSDTNEQDLSL